MALLRNHRFRSNEGQQFTGLVAIMLLVGTWVMVAYFINPRGEFPLADDWAYAEAVRSLLRGGGLQLREISTNIIAQIVWGELFCLPFGFSFIALRISTLTLGAVGVSAFYGLLREAGADRGTALFGALMLAFNPFYLVLSYTFMSDVPFTAVALISLYFLARGMRRDSRLEVATGLFLACAALLIRQPGLAIFMAFSLAYLKKSGFRLRNLLFASVSVAFGGFVQVLWDRWMKYRHILPAGHSLQAASVLSPSSYISWHATEPFAAGLIVISVYLGLFLFPLLLFIGPRRWAGLCRSRPLTLATLVFALFASYKLSYWRMPLLPNVLYDLGLGPATLRDAYLLRMRAASTPFWFVVTYVGFVGAVVLIQATFVAIGKAVKPLTPGKPEKRELLVMLLANGLIYLAPVAVLTLTNQAYDRYLLFLVPLGIGIIILVVKDVSPGKPRFPVVLFAIASLVLYSAFSIAGTHDYLSWNRARWEALDNLMTEQRLAALNIDGGYEFNASYHYDPKHGETAGGRSYWWVGGADFLVTFGPVPGFTELRRYPYRRWIPPPRGNILVLRRTAPSGPH